MSKKEDKNITKVLLVDDQPIVAETIKSMLAGNEDFEFEYVENPKDALKRATEFEPTVILQDLMMPGIDGMSLVKMYRANKHLRHVPVIVLSNTYEPDVKVQAFNVGANDYFEKRFESQDIDKELKARLLYHSNAYITRMERDQAYEQLEQAKAALDQEIKKAAEYIHSILPEELDNEKIKTEWRHIASTSLSGDSFDYAWLDDENFAFYILDVSGHGVGSALLSISALNVLRSTALNVEDYKNPSRVLSFLNERFKMSEQNDLYFTMWYGVYNIKDKLLTYAGAAHPSAIVKTGSEVTTLKSKNFLIGGLPNFEFEQSSIKLESGSELFIYTDGAYEIEKPDGTMWTFEEMLEFIKQNDSSTLLDDLYKYLQKLGNSEHLEDDYTILKLILK